MPRFEAGQAFVQVTPSMRGFHVKVKAELAKLRDHEMPIKPVIEEQQAQRQIGAFAAAMHKRISAAIRSLPKIELNADSSDADKKLAALRAELQTLSGKRIGVDIDGAEAEREIGRLQRELTDLGRQSPNVQVRTDTAAAIAGLTAVQQQARRLDGEHVNLRVSAQEVVQSITLMSLLTAGVSAVGFAAPAAVAGVAAIGAAGFGAASGVGALVAGLHGIGDGVEALEEGGIKAAEQLHGMSEEGRTFARMVHGEMLPALRGIRNDVQAAELPLFEQALRRLDDIAPDVSRHLSDTGRVIGELSVQGAEMVTSGPFRGDWATIMGANNRALSNFGDAGLHAFDATTQLLAVGAPLLTQFSGFAERGTAAFLTFIEGRRATGELGEFMEFAADRARELWDMTVQVTGGVAQFAQAAAPVGGVLLDIIGGIASAVGWLSDFSPELVQAMIVAGLAYTAFVKLGRGISGMGIAFASARDGYSTLINRFRSDPVPVGGFDTAARSVGGIRGAMSGLVGFLGGPWGVAIAAVTVALGAWSVISGRARQRQEELESASRDVATAIEEQNGQINEQVRRTAAQKLEEEGLLGTARQLGIELPRLTDAYLFQGASLDSLRGRLRTIIDENTRITQSGNIYTRSVNGQAVAAQTLLDDLNGLVGGLGATEAGERRVADATRGVSGAQVESTPTMDAYEVAVAGLGETTADVSTQVDDLAQAILGLSDQEFTVGEATQAVNDAFRTLIGPEGAFALARQEAANTGIALVDHAGNINTVTESGSNLQDEMAGLRDGFAQQFAAVLQSEQQMGRSYPEAHRAAQRATQGTIDRFRTAARQAGFTEDQVQGLIDRYFRIPPSVGTNVWANTRPAEQAVNRFIRDNDGRVIALRVTASRSQTGVPTFLNTSGLGRAFQAEGGILAPMATGGILGMQGGGRLTPMSGARAQVVPPDTWRVIGDRMQGRESFIPHDGSQRSLEILAETARLMGFALTPLALGAVLGFQAGAVAKPGGGGKTTADPAQASVTVPLDPLATAEAVETLTGTIVDLQGTALQPLEAELNTATAPAMTRFGTTTDRSWQQAQASVTRSTAGQIGQHVLLRGDHARLRADLGVLTRTSNASWSNMQATTSARVGAIRGPIFGGLHAGLGAIRTNARNTADFWGQQMGRIQPLTANPIRWALNWPINRGLVPAWNNIDRFFQLNRHWKGVPIGFAHGTEDHRAQIAHGGQPRVWNEPETGGEAYIPLAPAKRGRSERILATVAHEFGYALEPRFFADGGLWRAMFGIVRNQFPSAGLSSAYRPGDPGYHGSGRATDLTGPMRAIDRFLGTRFPNSTELIHTPGPFNLYQGRPHRYNAKTRADHYDHVHWAMANAAMLGNPQLGFFGAAPGFDIAGYLNQRMANTRRLIGDITRHHGRGNIPTAMVDMSNDAVAGAISRAQQLMATAIGPGGGAGVERWRGVGLRALAIAGQSPSNIGRLLFQMGTESGGNPSIVNRWDSNWVAGHPSVGLMQVIGPTYRAYRHPQFDFGPYSYGTSINPLSNILASIRYTLARYGSLAAGWRGVGYDDGGFLPPGYSTVYNGTGRPEPVLTDAQWRDITMSVQGGDGGHAAVVVNQTNYPGTPAERIVDRSLFKARHHLRSGRYGPNG